LVEQGEGFPAILRIVVEKGNFPALELVHTTDPLAEELSRWT
jgi:hypothetical protein